MKRIAEFHKVSLERFITDSKECGFVDDSVPMEMLETIWAKIKIPKRATRGSSGYDFFLPYSLLLQSTGTAIVPTGIRAEIEPGWCLILMPRSGLGFKYGLRLINTIGNIDSDYFYSENEGHIKAKLKTDVNISLREGDRFMQGVFMPHGLTQSDCVDGIRDGGFGSTGV